MPPKGRTTRNSNVDKTSTIKQEEIEIEPEKDEEEPFPEIDPFELECRLNARVHQVLSSEGQFQSGLGYLKQLARKKLEVQEGTSEDLNDRIKEQVNEKNRRLAKIDEWYKLQLARMQRRVDATKECALTSRQTNVINTQEKLLETLSNKEKDIISTIVAAKKVAQLASRAMAGKDIDEECETRTKKMQLSYSKIDRYRETLKYPVIVYQLTDKQISEDLAFFEDALAQKNLERELEKNKNLEALANFDKATIAKYGFPKKSKKIPIEEQKCVKILKIKIKKKKRDGMLKTKPKLMVKKEETTINDPKKTVPKTKNVTSVASTFKPSKMTLLPSKQPAVGKNSRKKVDKLYEIKKRLLGRKTKAPKLSGSSTSTETKIVSVSAPSTAGTIEAPVTLSRAKEDLKSS